MAIDQAGTANEPGPPTPVAEPGAMGVAQVQAALDELRLGISVIEFESSTATSQQAADNVGCQLGQIVKSLGFMINKATPVLVLASGDQSIDERKLAALFGVGRKKARMMNAEQCLKVLGYAPGGVPPIAHRSGGFAVYLDETLNRFDMVYAAGAAANAIFPVPLPLLQDMTGGIFADIARA
ncbi:MAG: YbaK/EbsC family protein [Chloroflexi bacterium]|nr:YbaK/EbsC family protein [Chloroflexota bacterium]